MKGSAVKWAIERIERERRIKLPSCLLNEQGLKELDRVVATHNAYLISRFYRNFTKYISLKPFDKISEKMKDERTISAADSSLIDRLVGVVKKDPEYFFDFVGNYYYISDIIEEMEEKKSLSRTLRISLILWIYLNTVELISKFFSDSLREYIMKIGREREFDYFMRYFRDGEHPTMGNMISVLEKLNFVNGEDSVFGKNKVIRNRISHANIYYDRMKNRIVTMNGGEYTIEKLQEDFQSLLDFLLEFVYRYNNHSSDLTRDVRAIFRKLSTKYLRIARAPGLRVIFNNVIFEWEK